MATKQQETAANHHQVVDPLPVDLASLPHEIFMQIFQYMSAEELCRLALCSRRWRREANQDALWRPLCQRNGWERYGTGAMDLLSVESQDSPYSSSPQGATAGAGANNASFHCPGDAVVADCNQLGLEGTCKWKEIYMKVRHLEQNWVKNRCRITYFDWMDDVQVDPNGSCVEFDEEYLVTGHENDMVKVWDIKSGCHQCTIRANFFAEFNPDCALRVGNGIVVTGCLDGLIKTFSAKTGKALQVLKGHEDWVTRVCFDGEIIASGALYGPDNCARVWHISDNACQHILETEETLKLGQVELQDKMVATTYGDGSFRLWDARSGVCVLIIRQQVAKGYALDWKLGDGIVVSVYREDMTYTVWSTKSGECIKSFSIANDFTLDDSCEEMFQLRVVGRLLVVSLCDTDDGVQLRVMGLGVYNLNGELLVTKKDEGMKSVCSYGNRCIVDRGEDGCHVFKATEGGLQRINVLHLECDDPRIPKTLLMNDTKMIFCEKNFQQKHRFIVHHYW